MKAAYRFESKHLGQAFMKELEEMGYERGCDNDKKCVINTFKGTTNTAWFNGGVSNSFGARKTFQLESQWNEALEHAREQLSAEFKNGDWVIGWNGDAKFVARFREFLDKDKSRFYCGEWYRIEGTCTGDYGDSGIISRIERKATPEEVEQALIKEAERRGYEHGNFKCIILHTHTADVGDSYKYVDGGLFLNGNAVYYEGEWAEIIGNKFFDWDVEKKGNKVIFAPECEAITFSTSTLDQIKKALEYVDDKTVKEVIDELDKILKQIL